MSFTIMDYKRACKFTDTPGAMFFTAQPNDILVLFLDPETTMLVFQRMEAIANLANYYAHPGHGEDIRDQMELGIARIMTTQPLKVCLAKTGEITSNLRRVATLLLADSPGYDPEEALLAFILEVEDGD